MAATKSFLNKEAIEKRLSDAGVEDVDGKIKEINAEVLKIIKRQIKESKPYVNEQYEGGESFAEVYPEYDYFLLGTL